MRLEQIAEQQPITNGFGGGTKIATYLVDGTRWARLTGYTPQDIRILAAALEQVK